MRASLCCYGNVSQACIAHDLLEMRPANLKKREFQACTKECRNYNYRTIILVQGKKCDFRNTEIIFF